jgi:hypothetical protein
MAILPKKTQDLLDFCDAHVTPFTTNAVAIGLTTAQATTFKNAAGAARANFNAAVAADNAKKAATLTSQTSVAALRKIAAETIALVKAFAESSATPPAVYTLANLPMPATPAPAPAPGTPTGFSASLSQSGVVTLKWKCANPPGIGGTIYECRRKINGGTFAFIGAVGTREFSDGTLPAGSTGVVYEITATRSTLRGNPAQFNVNFGIGGGGMFIASTSEGNGPSGEMKLAA